MANKCQFVGTTRNLKGSLELHVATQEAFACAKAAFEMFPKPDRKTMTALQEQWIGELKEAPAGQADEGWLRPVSDKGKDRKLKMRQASADSTLKDDDPEAYQAVVLKAMKDGSFDGSAADALDASIDADEAQSATMRRAAGDWDAEVQAQTAETVAEPEDVSASEAKELMDEGSVYLDVRSDEEFEQERAVGAVNVDWSGGRDPASFCVAAREAIWADRAANTSGGDKVVIVGCAGGGRAPQAAAALVADGLDVVVLKGGYPGWARDRSMLPVESGGS